MNATGEIMKLKPLVYGTYMATVDVFMLGMLKAIHLGWINKVFLFLPTLIYAMQPWVFLSALKYENMTIMNLLWDVMSGLMVTGTGLYFFNEKISRTQMIGIGFALVAIVLLTSGDLCE
jgi:multidrug transporter EmrE-like cation transporter